jgi:hypothetical protein
MKDALMTAFEADLGKLSVELDSFPDYQKFWTAYPSVPNSPGNLMLHLMGNLNHYIGAKLGKSGYVRDRPLEFSSGPVPRSEMKRQLDSTRSVVTDSINRLSDDDLLADFPADEGDDVRSVGAELVRILTHLNYHLGQINYHRRLTAGSKERAFTS